jgi:parallel beta-helix repeat protein
VDLPHRTVPDIASTLNFERIRQQAQSKIVFDVRDYGASGTGTADDTGAIQAAMDAASNSGGGTVLLPPGTYLVTTLYLRDNLTIVGNSQATLQATTSNPNPIFVWTDVPPDYTKVELENVTIQGLHFQGTGVLGSSYRMGILVHYGNKITIRDNTFADFSDGAITLWDCQEVQILHNTMRDCALEVPAPNYGWNVITVACWYEPDGIENTRQNYTLIDGNLVIGTEAGGIVVQGSISPDDYVTIVNNQVRDCGWVGIAMEAGGDTWEARAQNGIIANNHIENCKEGITWLNTAGSNDGTTTRNGIVANNYIDCSTFTDSKGILLGGSDIVITGNVVKADEVGIFWYSFTFGEQFNASIINNMVLHTNTGAATGAGISIWSVDGFQIANNYVHALGASSDGIQVRFSSNGNVSGNKIYNPGYHGIRLEGEDYSNIVVDGNQIENANALAGAYRGAIGLIAPDPSTVTDIHIRNNYANDDRTPKLMGYGVMIADDVTATNLVIEGNTLKNALTATFYNRDKATRVTNNWAGETPSKAAAATVTLPECEDVVTLTGNTNITSIVASTAGRVVTLLFTGTPTVTDGSNLTLAGNFVATADDTLTLVSDGTNWIEIARSAN